MTRNNPLGRDSMPFRDTMQRHYSTIENALYAAEQKCKDGDCKDGCPFNRTGPFQCVIHELREIIGDHIQQHDAMPGVPPCQCGGDCGHSREHRPIGVCTHGEVEGKHILCNSSEDCDFQRLLNGDCEPVYCGREKAALAMAEELEKGAGQ